MHITPTSITVNTTITTVFSFSSIQYFTVDLPQLKFAYQTFTYYVVYCLRVMFSQAKGIPNLNKVSLHCHMYQRTIKAPVI